MSDEQLVAKENKMEGQITKFTHQSYSLNIKIKTPKVSVSNIAQVSLINVYQKSLRSIFIFYITYPWKNYFFYSTIKKQSNSWDAERFASRPGWKNICMFTFEFKWFGNILSILKRHSIKKSMTYFRVFLFRSSTNV